MKNYQCCYDYFSQPNYRKLPSHHCVGIPFQTVHELTGWPRQLRARVKWPSQWYKNVAFGLCHLELNSLNHNFSWFSLKAKLQHGSTSYYSNHIQRDRKHCWELSIEEWTIQNRVTNVVTLQTLTDSDERLTLETSAFESSHYQPNW